MDTYQGLQAYYGDLHNHCGISYGKGTLEEALRNARESLDFCSVTGHAHWPDMPEGNQRTQPMFDFHQEGFTKLKRGWQRVREVTESHNEEGKFVTFLGFEIHSCAHGDYTVVYKDLDGQIIYKDIPELKAEIDQLQEKGVETIAFPHHIAYLRGRRGINWESFTGEHSPVVEIISSHGCSETDESDRPLLGVLGPCDWESTMQYGLEQGHVFGVVGSTDHHFAHPGSYGQGRTCIWAKDLTRDALWEAIQKRNTCALTGDKIELKFTLNGFPLGSIVPSEVKRRIRVQVSAGGAIDYVDIVKNNRLLRRFSACDFKLEPPGELIHTKLYLELGWGHDFDRIHWEVEFGVTQGKILSVEPRFRSQSKYSSYLIGNKETEERHHSHWEMINERRVSFETETRGNPNYLTNTSQGICLEVEMPQSGEVEMSINGKKHRVLLARLFMGAKAGTLYNEIEVPAWKLHKAPLPGEFSWDVDFEEKQQIAERDFYYIRVRQTNDQWAWSSPIFVRD